MNSSDDAAAAIREMSLLANDNWLEISSYVIQLLERLSGGEPVQIGVLPKNAHDPNDKLRIKIVNWLADLGLIELNLPMVKMTMIGHAAVKQAAVLNEAVAQMLQGKHDSLTSLEADKAVRTVLRTYFELISTDQSHHA